MASQQETMDKPKGLDKPLSAKRKREDEDYSGGGRYDRRSDDRDRGRDRGRDRDRGRHGGGGGWGGGVGRRIW